MSKQDLSPVLQSPLPQAPEVYSAAYMRRLVAELDSQLKQLKQPRYVLVAGMMTFDLPTAATGLRPGEVYIDGDTLRVAP